MPNRNTPLCGCSVPLKGSQSRNEISNLSLDKSKSLTSNAADGRSSRKPEKTKGRHHRTRTCDTSSSSLIAQQTRLPKNNTEQKKRSHFSRRSRSAERAESHYVYIDADDCVSRNEIHQINQVVAYATTPVQESTAHGTTNYDCPPEIPSRNSQQLYAIPSMTSPPPTYDVAVAKSWQTGLPPSYEDYLCHKYATLSRSHTPPPPWSISAAEPVSIRHDRRELSENRQQSREHLSHFTVANSNGQNAYQSQIVRDVVNASNPTLIFRKHVKQQRLRAMNRRSSSESRAHQQRLATMCEDGAFCMETTVIQSAFEDGVAFCSLM